MADAKKYDRCGKLYECCDKIMPFQSIKTVYVSYWKGRGEVHINLDIPEPEELDMTKEEYEGFFKRRRRECARRDHKRTL